MSMNNSIKGPWPYPEMWWCACVKNDCSAQLFGPHPTLESAQEEADSNIKCDIHIAIKGEPPVTTPLAVRPGNNPTRYDIVEIKAKDEWHKWFRDAGHRNPTYPGII